MGKESAQPIELRVSETEREREKNSAQQVLIVERQRRT